MPEQSQAERTRVALVFGDADAAGHLRDTVAEHVDVVYAASASDFDSGRLKESGATAALVNLDAFDLLDAIAARLNEAGVAVVFNDPEISGKLEGWERARWLRHLTAKLSGNSNYDPPRPAHETPPADTEVASAKPIAVPPSEPVIAERPLSSAEIEAMTADFVAVPALHAVRSAGMDEAQPEAGAPAGGVLAAAPELPERVAAPAARANGAERVSADNAAHPAAATGESDADALDIDTEALSAMIDARLAESERQVLPEPIDAWQDQAAVEEAKADSTVASADPVVDADPAPAAVPGAATPPATEDDDDLSRGMPTLGDWQLIDPEPAAAPNAESKPASRAEPAMSIDFSGLELVPMESHIPAELHSEPVEHRLYVDDRKQAEAAGKESAAPDSDGDQA